MRGNEFSHTDPQKTYSFSSTTAATGQHRTQILTSPDLKGILYNVHKMAS